MTASTGTAPGRIFMSYRREETAYPAAWLFDRLASHFGRDQVFKDVNSIELGDDFVEVINTAVGSCEVLLALIGSRWLTITDQDGHRRLDNPDNYVRLEVETALTRDVRVIPILVDEARIPRADELPASLAKLARLQALELSPGRLEADTRQLLSVLDRTIGEARERARQVRVSSAAWLVDTGFIILVVTLCIIAMEALIRPRTLLLWPWWAIVVASMLGIGVTLGGVRQYAVPASILLCVLTWHAVYSISVLVTSESVYSNQVADLSTECTVAAIISVALCGWVLVLLHKGIRNVNLFLAISMGCLSVSLALAAVAFHTGRAGVWSAVGVTTLATAVGVILTLIREHWPRSTSS